jgi:hypothetical protein
MIELAVTPQEELIQIKTRTRERAKASNTRATSELRSFGRLAVTYEFDPFIRVRGTVCGRGTWTCNGMRIGESHLRLKLRAALLE